VLESLKSRIGVECDLAQVAWSLRELAQSVRAGVVGGYQVTCSDGAEWECVDAFQRLFVEQLLPGLKPNSRAPLRSINLGSRYEEGAMRIADEHFSVPEALETAKLLVIKINAHVGVCAAGDGFEYGWLLRYHRRSACCGALARLLEGNRLPALDELRESFRSGGADRLAILQDPRRVPPPYRALLAALVNARLQAQRAADDIQKHRPETPTTFLVVPCVTLNRPGPDTELVVGEYGIDWTGPAASVVYQGLGDDPAAYRIRHEFGRARVEDDHWRTGGSA
jgi:hypothetical protein